MAKKLQTGGRCADGSCCAPVPPTPPVEPCFCEPGECCPACLYVSIFGITNREDDCHCPDCNSVNSTYFLSASGSDCRFWTNPICFNDESVFGSDLLNPLCEIDRVNIQIIDNGDGTHTIEGTAGRLVWRLEQDNPINCNHWSILNPLIIPLVENNGSGCRENPEASSYLSVVAGDFQGAPGGEPSYQCAVDDPGNIECVPHAVVCDYGCAPTQILLTIPDAWIKNPPTGNPDTCIDSYHYPLNGQYILTFDGINNDWRYSEAAGSIVLDLFQDDDTLWYWVCRLLTGGANIPPIPNCYNDGISRVLFKSRAYCQSDGDWPRYPVDIDFCCQSVSCTSSPDLVRTPPYSWAGAPVYCNASGTPTAPNFCLSGGFYNAVNNTCVSGIPGVTMEPVI